MYEVWLRPNVRVLLLALPPVCAVVALGVVFVILLNGLIWRVLGASLIAVGLWLALGVATQLRRPRVAYRDGSILFFLRTRRPVVVPVEVVEAFFLSQGPAQIPGKSHSDVDVVNLVARLSQRRPEWAHVEVKRVLGRWSDGYVTICGSWCEPLTSDVVRRLNRRLKEVSENRREAAR